MKKINILILSLLCTQLSFAANENDPVKVQESKSKFAGIVRLGGTYTKTEDRKGDESYGNKFFMKADVLGRYAISDSFAFNLGIGKWFGSGEVSADAGSVAYNMSAGVDWAITGSMTDRTRVETRLKKRKVLKNGKHYFITHTERLTIKNEIDGFRLGVHLNQAEFSRLADPVYGIGGILYYEQRADSQSVWQYGIRVDSMNNSRVNAQLAQLFVGFGFLP